MLALVYVITTVLLVSCAQDTSSFTAVKGEKGDRGFDGTAGATGEKGLKGDKGDKGDRGTTGAVGAKGEQGASGKNGAAGTNGKSCTVESTAQGVSIKCEDGTTATVLNGKNGTTGKDNVAITTVKVKLGDCTQVYKGVWVENIEGKVFDVYYNQYCDDSKGEYCDNVLPSFGHSGDVDNKYHGGSGTTCWADNIQLQGRKDQKPSTDIFVKIMDFN